ncbi:MAG: hypothetical protein JWP89_6952 [Schlesneria sp.]|nr:hypothetical protein [Schlesneria sp.]
MLNVVESMNEGNLDICCPTPVDGIDAPRIAWTEIAVQWSVIVRTYNEARHLPDLLSMLKRQEIPEEKLEIIVVDSGSTDDTVRIAEEAGCRVVHIPKADFSFGRSLNLGCEAATGEYLVFISGHCVPVHRNWLTDLTAAMIHDGASLTYGRQIGGPETKFSEHQLFEKYFPAENHEAPHPYFCNNANAAILKSAWQRFRYDEDLPGLEDMEIGQRLVRARLKICYAPEAVVYHYHFENWAQVKRRYEREAIALQRILPTVHVSALDALRYWFAGVLGDWAKAILQRSFLRKAVEIVTFRACQFWGTWRGSNSHKQLTRQMKDRYYYPI